MKASETTLRKLIGGEKQFVVPLFQRPYAWTSKQFEPLWSDVLAQADALASNHSRAHFLGSVVLAPSPQMTISLARWIVVDGQQRLTTLLLLLCAIRDHQLAEDLRHRDRINELHLINKFEQGDTRYRLLPTQVNRDAFKAHVAGCYWAEPAHFTRIVQSDAAVADAHAERILGAANGVVSGLLGVGRGSGQQTGCRQAGHPQW